MLQGVLAQSNSIRRRHAVLHCFIYYPDAVG